jgi:membrane protein implicated in regulation of membrane protease activity
MASTLQSVFEFTDDDLVANRAGHLSPAQQPRLAKKQGLAQVANIIFGVGFLVILVVIAIIVLPGLLAPQPAGSSAVSPGIIALVLVAVLGVVVFSFLRTRRKMRGVAGAVFTTEGEAKTRARMVEVGEGGAGTMYRLTVGKVTFPLSSGEQLAAFTEGQRYRVYYVKGTLPVVVSAEAV